jgi:hypothetical protein
MNFKKEKTFPAILLVVQIWKNYAPEEIITYFQIDSEQPRTAILASHFYWFGRFVSSTGVLTSTAVMVQ